MNPALVVAVALAAGIAVGLSGIHAQDGKTRRKWALAGILFAGAVLRLYHPGQTSLWLDEFGTYWAVHVGSLAELRRRVFDSVPHSPAYYLIVHAITRWFGVSEVSLRATSIVAGIAAVPAMYWLVRTLCPRRDDVALTAALVFSLALRPLDFSLEARPYALACLLAIITTTAWIGAVRNGAWRGGIAFALAAAATVYVHWLSAILVAVQAALGFALLFSHPHPRRSTLRFAVCLMLFCVMILPLAPKLLHDLSLANSLDWMRGIDDVTRRRLARETLFDPLVTGTLVFSGLAHAVLRLRGRQGALGAEERWALTAFAGLYAWSIVCAAGILLISGKSFFVPRYLYFLTIVAVPPAALALGLLPGKTLRLGLLVAVLVPTVLATHVQTLRKFGSFADFEAEQRWRDGIAVLDRSWQDGDLVILRSGFIEENLVAATGDPAATVFIRAPLAGFYNRRDYGQILSLTKDWSPGRYAAHLAGVKGAIVERWGKGGAPWSSASTRRSTTAATSPRSAPVLRKDCRRSRSRRIVGAESSS